MGYSTTQKEKDGKAKPKPVDRTEQTEAWLLGAMLAGCLPDDAPETADFSTARHQRIARAILNVRDNGGSVDALTVAEELQRLGELGDPVDLFNLMDVTPSGAAYYISTWSRQVQEAAQRRRIAEYATGLAKRASDPTATPEELLENIREFAAGSAVTKLDDRSIDSKTLDASEFDLRYLIDGVLVANQPCVLAGGKKTLKTNIAIDLTLSLASGAKFLNAFYVSQPVRVALVSGESGAATIQETARRIARSKPWVNLADYTNARWSFDLPLLGEPSAIASLRRFVRRYKLQVLILDPAYLMLPLGDDASNLFKVGEYLQPLGRLAADEGVTLVLIHHLVKTVSVTDAPPELESIAWAGFQEWARQWMLLSRRARYNPDQPGHHELWFAAGGSAGHSLAKALNIEEGDRRAPGGRRWEVVVTSVGEAIAEQVEEAEAKREQRNAAKAERQRQKDCEAVLAALKSGPLTERQLSRGVVKQSRLTAVLQHLETTKQIARCTITGANRQSYPAWCLPASTPSPSVNVDADDVDDGDTTSSVISGAPIYRGADDAVCVSGLTPSEGK